MYDRAVSFTACWASLAFPSRLSLLTCRWSMYDNPETSFDGIANVAHETFCAGTVLRLHVWAFFTSVVVKHAFPSCM